MILRTSFLEFASDLLSLVDISLKKVLCKIDEFNWRVAFKKRVLSVGKDEWCYFHQIDNKFLIQSLFSRIVFFVKVDYTLGGY